MKIVNGYKTCQFGEIKQGECFIYNGAVFMKVFHEAIQSFNSINMSTGILTKIGQYVEVNPVSSELRWLNYEN